MSDPPPLPPKKDVALALLEGPSLYVHLDARRDEVMVPPQFKTQSQLTLQVGLNMPVPISDLEVDERGISCTLSFNRRPFWCEMPWTAIFALVGEDGRGMVWPEDVPPEVAVAGHRGSLRAVPSGGSPRKPRKPKAKAKPKHHRAAEDGSGALPLDQEPLGDDDLSPSEQEPARPVLAAVPAAPASTASTDAEGDGPAEPDPDGDGKVRKLPPYLRVIK